MFGHSRCKGVGDVGLPSGLPKIYYSLRVICKTELYVWCLDLGNYRGTTRVTEGGATEISLVFRYFPDSGAFGMTPIMLMGWGRTQDIS